MSNALHKIIGNPTSGKFYKMNRECWITFDSATDRPYVHFEQDMWDSEQEVLYFPAGQNIPSEWAQSKFFVFKVY